MSKMYFILLLCRQTFAELLFWAQIKPPPPANLLTLITISKVKTPVKT